MAESIAREQQDDLMKCLPPCEVTPETNEAEQEGLFAKKSEKEKNEQKDDGNKNEVKTNEHQEEEPKPSNETEGKIQKGAYMKNLIYSLFGKKKEGETYVHPAVVVDPTDSEGKTHHKASGQKEGEDEEEEKKKKDSVKND